MNGGDYRDVAFLHPVALDARAAQWLGLPGLISPTLPGHGQRYPRSALSLDDMADEIAGWTSGPLHLVGCSMGGMVAMRFALRHPERTASLLLCSTTARVARAGMLDRAARTDRQGAQALAQSTMDRWFSATALAGAALADPVQYAYDQLRGTPTQVLSAAWRAIAEHDVLDQLSVLGGIPATCLAGRNDASTPLAAMEATANAIPGARLVVTDDPHMGFLESPTDFSARLIEHLAWAGRTA